jgi:hypothetical protein
VLRVAYFLPRFSMLGPTLTPKVKITGKTSLIKEKKEFLLFHVKKEGHVLEDPKGGTFLPKKDIWSP